MLGDFVEVGCGTVLNPGTVIGKNTNVYIDVMLVDGGIISVVILLLIILYLIYYKIKNKPIKK